MRTWSATPATAANSCRRGAATAAATTSTRVRRVPVERTIRRGPARRAGPRNALKATVAPVIGSVYAALPSAANTPLATFAQMPPPWLPAELEVIALVPARIVIPVGCVNSFGTSQNIRFAGKTEFTHLTRICAPHRGTHFARADPRYLRRRQSAQAADPQGNPLYGRPSARDLRLTSWPTSPRSRRQPR